VRRHLTAWLAVVVAALVALSPLAAQTTPPAAPRAPQTAAPSKAATPKPAARPAPAPRAQAPAAAPQRLSPPPAPDRDSALTLARTALAEGRAEQGIAILRDTAQRYSSVLALLELARVHTRQRDFPAALDTLKRAQSLAPNAEDVLSGFAQVSLAAGAYTPGAVALQNLTRLCPTVAQYHYLLGVALMQVGDMVAAVESLTEADRLEPNKALTLIALGLAYNSRKMFAEAKPLLLRGLELEPDSIDGVAALAESEEGLGELDQAGRLAQRALARDPRHANANLVMGLVLMQRQQFDAARGAFEKTIAAQPNLPKAYYQLSLAYARLGDEANAQKQVVLYREAQKRMEDRVNEMRAETGMSGQGGMGK
jgi:tetratricopeptide (TPR) repeat protein